MSISRTKRGQHRLARFLFFPVSRLVSFFRAARLCHTLKIHISHVLTTLKTHNHMSILSLRMCLSHEPAILVTLVGTVVLFSALSMLVFASWHVRSSKINTWREREQLFVGMWVQYGVSQLNVTRIVVQWP